jgi:hypothetical protein
MRYSGLTDVDLAAVRAASQRELTCDEVAAYAAAPMTAEERAGIDEMIDWFTRRYPSPGERLAWARRAWRRLNRAMPRPGE